MIIVTGAAGFIGSNLVWALNRQGLTDIVLVDQMDSTDKFKNLHHLHFRNLITPDDFLISLDSYNSATIVFHQGAITDTTLSDGARMMQQNYDYSKQLLSWCQRDHRRFIYASSAAVYGDGNNGFAIERQSENPLNIYGFSKLMFDRYMEQQLSHAQIVGLRYFNVYGPQEKHKGRMASVPWHLMNQARNSSTMRLFEGSEHFKRDFVHVDDVIKVNLFFMDNPHLSGLFNIGTGEARTFADIGEILLKLMPFSSLQTIPFPKDLKGRYQKSTCADLSLLYAAGYHEPWISPEDGIADYHHYFINLGGYRPVFFI
ncbi:MAG: ADP-glyceromanno-heptose 6-epimerase [Endozoicomonadaceae bacterium]|nr:ADP-glyceromanno-heptose 6-epimerase [Endozoicomonadaceae bacterium]